MQIIMDAIRSVRNIRSQMNVVPSRKTKLIIVAVHHFLKNSSSYFEKLASASETVVTTVKDGIDDNAVNVLLKEPQSIFIMTL